VLQIPHIQATALQLNIMEKHACTQHGCKCTWADGKDISRQASTSSCILIVLSQ